NCSSRSSSSAKVAVNEPGDSAKARKRTSRYTDHSDSSSPRTVISVMIHFVPLRRHRRAPSLAKREEFYARRWRFPAAGGDGPDAGDCMEIRFVQSAVV